MGRHIIPIDVRKFFKRDSRILPSVASISAPLFVYNPQNKTLLSYWTYSWIGVIVWVVEMFDVGGTVWDCFRWPPNAHGFCRCSSLENPATIATAKNTEVYRCKYLGKKKQYGGFHKWGYLQMDGFCWGKSNLEMDDDWGIPYLYGTPIYRRVWTWIEWMFTFNAILTNQIGLELSKMGFFCQVKREGGSVSGG